MTATGKSGPELIVPETSPELGIFRKDVGVWDATIEVSQGPDKPPLVSRGMSTSRLACGGHWLITEFRNDTTGFDGHGIFGYDPAKGKYIGTWIDPMRTFLAIYEGSYDALKKTMTYLVDYTTPQGKNLKWREVTETIDSDTQVWRQIMAGPGGQEFETMRATYKRRSQDCP